MLHYCEMRMAVDDPLATQMPSTTQQPVLIDASHAIAHNKVMIIDSDAVITGSFNFTKAAEERNAENLLIIYYKELSALYAENWRRHHLHSEPLR